MSTALGTDNALFRSPVWFADGNTVLRAGSVLFKIFQGLLMDKSPVLENLFLLTASPHSPSSDNAVLFEGCVVILMDDNPQDLEYFLRAFSDPEYEISIV
jgi:hypothetical protein